MGNYPSGTFSSPGLKARKTEFYYVKVPNYSDRFNLDKIIATESGSQVLEPDLAKQKETMLKNSPEKTESQPELDLEKTGGTKRKLNTLFKVFVPFI